MMMILQVRENASRIQGLLKEVLLPRLRRVVGEAPKKRE